MRHGNPGLRSETGGLDLQARDCRDTLAFGRSKLKVVGVLTTNGVT